jgi:uncharacterized protein YneF (UPF0154 family)
LTVKPRITVQVKYGEVEKTFSGSLEEIWLSIYRFFSEFIPSFEIAKKLTLSVDLQEITKECEGLIAFSSEGANVLVPREKLTDNETLLLWLLASYVGFRLGLFGKENLSKDELQQKLGKNPKITSTRLGELVKAGLVSKTAEDTYKITSAGLFQMRREIIPRIRAKMNA